MVHRPIFLGISIAVSQKMPSLDLSITINDGFFVLGSRYYTFPIISEGSDRSPTTSISPLMSLDQMNEEEDNEFEELKGMYITLKKKIVISKGSSTDALDNHKTQDMANKATATRINCQRDLEEGNLCIIQEKIISKLPPQIERECCKDTSPEPEDYISFEHYDEESLNSLNSALLVVIDKWLGEYTKGGMVKVVGAGISTCSVFITDFIDKIKTLLWQKYDILPCFFSGDRKPLDQQSETLARKCASLFGQENLPRLSIIENNKVNIDVGYIWFCSLEDYRERVGKRSDTFMKDLVEAYNAVKSHKIAFFSSTPQGGGVALMRHALVRFLKMLGLEASWYVCMPSPSVFNITKKKIHNILQSVAPPELELTEADQNRVDKWLKNNYEVNWKGIIGNYTEVILDDHQMARLAPIIKKDYPNVKIIYRSHIQIRSERIKDSKQMRNVWNYLWEGLKAVDYFISHPIDTSVPAEIPEEKVVFQPAGTDPLDGLNKNLEDQTSIYYQNVFNRICIDNREPPVNFSKPYIVQIARFDPSKGIPDLLDAYYKLYQKFIENHQPEEFSVGLVLCGHGSVDDPESTLIYNQTAAIIDSEPFQIIKHLITKIRMPPSDQLLNIILKNAQVCCQLSFCEGYEVKVTESLMKKVPVIVYNVGGLPLQVKNGINGYIVEKNDTKKVSEHLYNLFFNPETYKFIKDNINPNDVIHITTPFQALFWLRLLQMSEKNQPANKINMAKEMKDKYL